MTDTQPVTLDLLLSSVHLLQEGDVLIFTLPEDITPEMFQKVSGMVNDKLESLGVECLVVTSQIQVDVFRKENLA